MTVRYSRDPSAYLSMYLLDVHTTPTVVVGNRRGIPLCHTKAEMMLEGAHPLPNQATGWWWWNGLLVCVSLPSSCDGLAERFT